MVKKVLDNYNIVEKLCKQQARSKENQSKQIIIVIYIPERDMTHKKNLPKGENPSPEYPLLDLFPLEAIFFAALRQPPLQFVA